MWQPKIAVSFELQTAHEEDQYSAILEYMHRDPFSGRWSRLPS